jgi:hypothetical protein
LLGPVTTFSSATGLAYCFAQLGSMDMSIIWGFTGIPSTLTCPLTAPFSGLAEDRVMTLKTAATATITFVACMYLSLLIFS